MTSHANFCDDGITAKADNDITKSIGTTILCIYVSKGLHFGLLIRRTTVNTSVKYPGKQNLFKLI